MNPCEPTTSRRSGRRPVLTKGDRQEGALLDAVEELLATTPLEKLSLAQIAAHAGLSRSAVYFYFDNKTALAEAAILRALEHLSDTYGDETDGADETDGTDEVAAADPAASVEKYLARYTEMWRRSSTLLRTGVDLMGRRPTLRVAWEAVVERGAQGLVDLIERHRGGTAGTGAGAGDPRATALAICWMCERTYYMLYTREHTPEEEAELQAVLAPLILHGIGHTPGPTAAHGPATAE